MLLFAYNGTLLGNLRATDNAFADTTTLCASRQTDLVVVLQPIILEPGYVRPPSSCPFYKKAKLLISCKKTYSWLVTTIQTATYRTLQPSGSTQAGRIPYFLFIATSHDVPTTRLSHPPPIRIRAAVRSQPPHSPSLSFFVAASSSASVVH